MTDIMSSAERSARMSKVRQADTEPELVLRRALHALGYRYRLHPKDLPGRPDIVLPRFAVAIFVHGCFWHGHACRAGRLPTSNTSYWSSKIDANRARDAAKELALESAGWHVLTVWECEIKSLAVRQTTIARVVAELNAKADTSRARRGNKGIWIDTTARKPA